jgi:hypothetical protein
MAQPARKPEYHPSNVQLTIVPTDSFDDPDNHPTMIAEPVVAQAPKKPKKPMKAKPAEAKAAPAPAKAPAPRKARTGLLVAGALGGGMMMGGGAVGLLALVAGALGAVALGGAGLHLWMSSEPEIVEVPMIDPIVVEAGTDEAVDEGEQAAAPAEPSKAAPAAPAGGSAEPTPAPVASKPAPAPAAPTAPASPNVGDEAMLADTVTVKILTDPPAALIRVDGVEMGRSPAKLTLEPGSHQLGIESGKAFGVFPIDAGLDTDRYCFEVRGKRLSMVDCN